jgi:putative transposase
LSPRGRITKGFTKGSDHAILLIQKGNALKLGENACLECPFCGAKNVHLGEKDSAAQANRHYIPGHIWRITLRCHKRVFLLKFAKDRNRWLQWVFGAKKRYPLDVLNHAVTSSHIHLLVVDGVAAAIPKSVQLVAGKTAQVFNVRNQRKGAFWEDRYHATAVEKGDHLMRCLVYIDLNMVRSGVVKHPTEWAYGGYVEIQNPPLRYGSINRAKLIECCGFGSEAELRANHREWVEEALKSGDPSRRPEWTERALRSEAKRS